MSFKGDLNPETLEFHSTYKNISIHAKLDSMEVSVFIVPPPMDLHCIHATKDGLNEALIYIHKQDPTWAVVDDGNDWGIMKTMKVKKMITPQYLDQLIEWSGWFFKNIDIYHLDVLPF